MSNLGKLSAIAAICFATIVFGACGGGSGGGGGNYSGGSYPNCQRYALQGADGQAAFASCTATSTSSGTVTSMDMRYTVTNGVTYYATGTSTEWRIYTGTSTSTN